MNITVKISYRKTKEGEWAAYGPASAIRPGLITVTKASGETKTEEIVRVSKPFNVDGKPFAYGYLKPTSKVSGSGSSGSVRTGCSCGSRTVGGWGGPLDPKFPACWTCRHDHDDN